jgi:hypothetical protein
MSKRPLITNHEITIQKLPVAKLVPIKCFSLGILCHGYEVDQLEFEWQDYDRSREFRVDPTQVSTK